MTPALIVLVLLVLWAIVVPERCPKCRQARVMQAGNDPFERYCCECGHSWRL